MSTATQSIEKKFINDLVEFYQNEKDIFDFEIEFLTHTDNDMTIMQLSYFTSENKNPFSKCFVTLNFFVTIHDDLTEHIKNGVVVKRDVFGEYQKFSDKELKRYDYHSFELTEKAKLETNQKITDWFFKKQNN